MNPKRLIFLDNDEFQLKWLVPQAVARGYEYRAVFLPDAAIDQPETAEDHARDLRTTWHLPERNDAPGQCIFYDPRWCKDRQALFDHLDLLVDGKDAPDQGEPKVVILWDDHMPVAWANYPGGPELTFMDARDYAVHLRETGRDARAIVVIVSGYEEPRGLDVLAELTRTGLRLEPKFDTQGSTDRLWNETIPGFFEELQDLVGFCQRTLARKPQVGQAPEWIIEHGNDTRSDMATRRGTLTARARQRVSEYAADVRGTPEQIHLAAEPTTLGPLFVRYAGDGVHLELFAHSCRSEFLTAHPKGPDRPVTVLKDDVVHKYRERLRNAALEERHDFRANWAWRPLWTVSHTVPTRLLNILLQRQDSPSTAELIAAYLSEWGSTLSQSTAVHTNTLRDYLGSDVFPQAVKSRYFLTTEYLVQYDVKPR